MERKIDRSLAKALGHEARRDILRTVARSDDHLSPTRISDMTGEALGNVVYHTRVLEECGALVLVPTKQGRGATEHFCRIAPLLRETQWAWALLELDGTG